MSIPFTKYSGCGNDFIIIDNRLRSLSLSKACITKLCHRHQGIGADGLIFLELSSPVSQYRMRIFNANGSEAEMCGNGLRCLAHYIRTIEDVPSTFTIETMHQRMDVSFNGQSLELVSVAMPPPTPIILKKLSIEHHELKLHCLDTGVPHAVHFVDELENDALLRIAPSIRFHQEFHPKGTNVNFAKILKDQTVEIRTYERGVESETQACGTGAAASAIAASHAFKLSSPVKILTRSGECLHINFQGNGHQFTDLVMTGPAKKIFDGTFDSKILDF